MRIGIVGGGVVGRATARVWIGHCEEVRVHDVVPERSTHSLEDVLACGLIFVCLPTPQKNASKQCDLRHVRAFFNSPEVTGSSRNFVLRSTVPIDTTDEISRGSCLPNLAYFPEFLTARCAAEDALSPARHVVGIPGYGTRSTHANLCGTVLCEALRRRFPGTPLYVMSAREAEAVKLFQNGWGATKVALFNEFRSLTDAWNLDWEVVRAGLLSSGIVGAEHTQVPGPDGKRGFGGACLILGTAVSVDGGWVPIEDVEVGDTVRDHNGPTMVTGKTERTVGFTVTVRARGRDVTGSADHIHVVVEESGRINTKLLKDVVPGEWVVLPQLSITSGQSHIIMPPPPPYVKSWKQQVEWTPDLAWMVGLWLADGFRGSYPGKENRRGYAVHWSLGIGYKDAVADKLERILTDLGLNPGRRAICGTGTFGSGTSDRPNIWVFRVRTAWFYHMFEAMCIGSNGNDKRAPMDCPYPDQLIGGWLDGDGSRTDGTICGYSERRELIRDFDNLLLSLDVCAQIGRDGRQISVSTRDDLAKVCAWTVRHRPPEERYVRDTRYASPTLRKCRCGWAAKVKDVVMVEEPSTVIALETESGYYIANGQLTHNCLPKDLANLINQYETLGFGCEVLSGALARNERDRG